MFYDSSIIHNYLKFEKMLKVAIATIQRDSACVTVLNMDKFVLSVFAGGTARWYNSMPIEAFVLGVVVSTS